MENMQVYYASGRWRSVCQALMYTGKDLIYVVDRYKLVVLIRVRQDEVLLIGGSWLFVQILYKSSDDVDVGLCWSDFWVVGLCLQFHS